MTAGVPIEELCRTHRNEDPHTEHVAQLALKLYDAVKGPLGFAGTDRKLLEQAARLHDIGYAADPPRHVDAGLTILSSTNIAGMEEATKPYVLAAILLHSGDYTQRMDHPVWNEISHRKKAYRLGALLRVADGLDHAHAQDVRIRSVKIVGDQVRVRVRAPSNPFNGKRARDKSDLWNNELPLKALIEETKPDPYPFGFDGLVTRRSLPTAESARRLLFVLYRIITWNVPGAIQGDDTECLHDIRVAIRRFRAGLRFFRRRLPDFARELNPALREINRRLGPYRDHDVWMEYLVSPTVLPALEKDPKGPTFLEQMRARKRDQQEELKLIFKSEEWTKLMARMAAFLRIDLPEWCRNEKARPIGSFAATKLFKTFERIMAHDYLMEGFQPEEMHDLRRICRRERYWAEMFAPLFGDISEDMAERLRAIVGTLGSVHDADVALEQVRRDIAAPQPLAAFLEADRANSAAAFHKAWIRLHRKKFVKQTLRELSKAGRRK